MYIWQSKNWPNFSFRQQRLDEILSTITGLQNKLVGCVKDLPENLDQQAEMDALIQNALQTSEIEGEHIDAASVRSSVAKQFGLSQAGIASNTKQSDSLVSMLKRATYQPEKPLSIDMLFGWQSALFPEPSLYKDIRVGMLRGDDPMQVVSQRGGREVVHFEALPGPDLNRQLELFLNWLNLETLPTEENLTQGLLKAAIAHLWLITLHPFDDGNGRVTRAVTDRMLAKTEHTSIRFYSLSATIESNRQGYYKILESTQSCQTGYQKQTDSCLEITEWVEWFLNCLEQALQQGLDRIKRVIIKANFWQTHSQTVISKRQIKVLNRLLDFSGEQFTDGINAGKYKNLLGISKATATRDLADLVIKGCLIQLPGGGRSTRYVINSIIEKSKKHLGQKKIKEA